MNRLRVFLGVCVYLQRLLGSVQCTVFLRIKSSRGRKLSREEHSGLLSLRLYTLVSYISVISDHSRSNDLPDGVDTVSNCLVISWINWLIGPSRAFQRHTRSSLLCRYTQIFKRGPKQNSTLVGNGRLPTFDDSDFLPYCSISTPSARKSCGGILSLQSVRI